MIALMLLLVLGLPQAGSSQSPKRVTVADAAAAPDTLESLWLSTDVIVRARVQSAETQLAQLGSEQSPVTKHLVLVQEVLKGPVKEGTEISVFVPVGTVRTPDGTVHESYASGRRRFDPGEELVLFLTTARALGGYDVAFGVVGHYAVDGPSVAIPAPARKWSPFNGRMSIPTQDFLAQLRQLKNKVGLTCFFGPVATGEWR